MNLLNGELAYTQNSCTGDTPFFQVDLSANPGASWLSPSVVRDGNCCGGGADQSNCIEVEVLLHPNATGILFDVASGADPGGALFYQVNCQGAPLSSPTNTICLDGPGPHFISFCKVGNNQNTYEITSIPEATASNDITSTPSCPDTIGVQGVDPTTITWNSIAPGNAGDYNAYLENLDGTETGTNSVPFSGETDVIVSPDNGAPGTILYEVCATPIGGCDTDPFCDTVAVNVYDDMTLDLAPENPTICYDDVDVELTATVAGGVPPISYSWSTGESTSAISVQSGGTYYVDVTDANGCYFLTDTVVVNEVANEIKSIAGNDVTICGEPIPQVSFNGIVDGTNAGVWSNGQGNYAPSNQVLEIVYTPTQNEVNNGFVDLELAATNTLGCPGDTDIVRINLPTFNTVFDTVIDHVSCNAGTDGSIDLTALSGHSISSYEWSNGATTSTINNLSAGTYSVILTDENGCTENMSFVIEEPPALEVDAVDTSSYASGHPISCFGANDGYITIALSGGTPGYSYEWSNGVMTDSIGAIGPGMYTFVGTDANGCEVEDSIEIIAPPPLQLNADVSSDYNGEDISCFGAGDGEISVFLLDGGSPGYTVTWLDSGGNTVSNDTVIDQVNPGEYVVIAEDVNGCKITDTVVVTQPDSLEVGIGVLSDYEGNAVSCEDANDGEIEANVNGGTPQYTYEWDTNPVQTTENINGLGIGTYTVVTTDANGCTATDEVTLEGYPLPELQTSMPDEACEDERVQFSATSELGTAASWEFENGTQYNGFEHDVYFDDIGCFDAVLTVTTEYGCQTVEELSNHICVNPLPYADFEQSSTDVTTFSPIVQFWDQSTGATNVEWFFGDGATDNISNPYHEYPVDSSGTYQVTMVANSQYGCTDTVTSLVVVDERLLIYVPNTFTPDDDQYNQVFLPVLTQGFDPYNYELLVFNRWGEVLFESHDAQVGWDGKYGGKIVKDGTYVWKIKVKDKDGIMRQFKGHVNVLR